jgi:hypothetical protein
MYDLSDSRCWYDVIVQEGDYLYDFLQYLIQNDRMKQLLSATLRLGRKQQARDLCNAYALYWSKKYNWQDGNELEVSFKTNINE